MGTVFTEKVVEDDIIRWKDYQGYVMDKVTIYNRANEAIVVNSIMGQPLRADESQAGKYMFLLGGGESYLAGFVFDPRGFNVTSLADNATIVARALMRGPAILDGAMLPTTDAIGDALSLANLTTAAMALIPPIKINSELSPTVTQER